MVFLMGRGQKGEEVYILATGEKPDLVLKTITKALPLLGEDPSQYQFINCATYLNRCRKEKAKERWGLCGWYNTIGRMAREVQRSL